MKNLLLGAVALAAMSSPASAGLIFDSQALGEPLCGTTPFMQCFTETRGSDLNYAAVLQFSSNVTVSKIGVFSSVDDAQNVKFLIFDSQFNGGTGNLLFSQTKSYGVTSQQFLYTDAMSFTFQAGKTYDIGILGDGGRLTGRWITADLSSGGITEISRNANINNFSTPSTGGYAGVSPYIQLWTNSGVPEPAAWAMMLAGFGLVGGAMRRREKTAVTYA